MKGYYYLFMCLLSTTSFFTVNAQTLFLSDPVTMSAKNTNDLSGLIKDYQVLSLNPKLIENICAKGSCNIIWETPDRTWNITLEENKLLSPNYKMIINGKSTTQQVLMAKAYKGLIGDNPDNYVRLTIGKDFLDGYLKIDTTLLFIKPVKHILPNYPYDNQFVLFKSSDIIYNPSILDCGVLNETKTLGEQIITQSLNTVLAATASCNVVEIATEADYEFYQLRGSSVTTANNSILSELNQVEGLYQSTFNIQFIITLQNVWTTSSDPYTSATSSGTTLNEFTSYWQSNFSNVPRDYAHLFTGKSGFDVRGTAASVTVGRMCEVSSGTYAISAANVNNINIANTTAHEIGHLFNAGHIGTTCTSLMCTLTPSSGPDYRSFIFAQASINTINSWISGNNGCLTDLKSVYITGTSPVCSTGSYSVQGLPSGSTVTTWSSNNSGLTMSSSTGTRQNNYNGEATITASGILGSTLGCTYESEMTVWVGLPEHVTGTLSGPSTVYTSNLYIYSVTDQNHWSGSFDWRTPRGFTHYAGGDGYNYVQVGINENAWDGYVQIWRTNACGNGGARFMYVTVEEGGGGPIETIVSPNPAIDEISVDFANPEQLQDYITSLDVNNRSMNIEIVSLYGEKVFSGSIGNEGLKLNLKNVKRGLYVIKVYNNELSSEVKLLLE